MSERCPKCGLRGGDHFVSCPEVADTLRVQVRELEGCKYTGLLWIDERDNSTNFKFNIASGDFQSARKVLKRFIAILQERLDKEERCPFYERADSPR